MAQLLMVNPRKRSTARSTAQKAATRSTAQKKAATRKTSPKRRSSSTSVTTKRRVVRRRRNPIGRKVNLMDMSITATKNGAIGSLGAIAGSLAGNYLPVPAQFKSGPMKIAAEAMIAIGVGFGVSKFVDKQTGILMAQGGVTVALHETMKGQLSAMIPQLNLSGFDEYDTLLGDDLLGMDDDYDDEFMDNEFIDDLSAYDDLNGMGYSGAGYTGSDSDLDSY